MNFEELLASITPDIYDNLCRSVEQGKWPDGRRLTDDQRETCLQAIIAYDAANKPREDRVGYLPPKEKHCDSNSDKPVGQPIKWRD